MSYLNNPTTLVAGRLYRVGNPDLKVQPRYPLRTYKLGEPIPVVLTFTVHGKRCARSEFYQLMPCEACGQAKPIPEEAYEWTVEQAIAEGMLTPIEEETKGS